jgi:hypothetical protein
MPDVRDLLERAVLLGKLLKLLGYEDNVGHWHLTGTSDGHD